MSNPEIPKTIVPKQALDTISNNLESLNLIPMRVNDERDIQYRSFDLDKFVGVTGRLRSEGLFKISREFQDSDYGKYMSVFASAESDRWNEAVQKAKAIEITATNPPSRGYSHREGRTQVEVKILMTDKDGRVFNFYFDPEGRYSQGGWQDVHIEKRLVGPKEDENNFTLSIEAEEIKKLEQ